MARFVETLEGEANLYVAIAHIVSLRFDDKNGCWLATTADHRTFNLSLDVVSELLDDAVKPVSDRDRDLAEFLQNDAA